MRIEIFELAIGGGLDLDRKVAEVLIGPDREVSVQCFNPRREAIVRDLFLEDSARFVPAGDMGDGLETFAAGSPEAIRQVLDDDLYGYSLGGRIVEP